MTDHDATRWLLWHTDTAPVHRLARRRELPTARDLGRRRVCCGRSVAAALGKTNLSLRGDESDETIETTTRVFFGLQPPQAAHAP